MARDDNARLRRDEANVGPDPRQARSLVPMRDVKSLRIGDGEPDIRGWPVYTSTGREVGDVQELLVDTTVMEVMMLDIDLRQDDRHTLAPLRAAWIDREHRRVIIDASEIAEPDDLPTLGRRNTMTDDEVAEFDRRYTRAYGQDEGEHDYRYRHGNEDELRFAHRRRGKDAEVVESSAPDEQSEMARQAARDAVAAREAAERAARSAERLAAQHRDRLPEKNGGVTDDTARADVDRVHDRREDRDADEPIAQPVHREPAQPHVQRHRLEPGEQWTTEDTEDAGTERTVRIRFRDRDAGESGAPRERPDDRRR